uniref:Uncharacterized protein n=1 Tax=Amphora coffeiformis TaxID=265554 RepID=A0A7S3L5M3_9STRA|mmetsp:Transcript_9402/g.17953  ORF Transcript_9402/g.17953 Transcript_9402/m.17953 type:complete len:191 (+) Transcript_9402:92-664(+)|eukprot:scaffold10570_cov176-Amphora_coffeaeformis.AAC.12
MGNAHAVKIHPPSCSKIVQGIRRTRCRRRSDARGAFPTFEDESFPSQLPRSTSRTTSEKTEDIHPRRERRRWKGGVQRIKGGVQRIKNIGRRRRNRLDTLSESQEEETMCFYQPGEEEDVKGLQESVWKILDNRDLDQERRRRLDTLSESEEDETMILYRKVGRIGDGLSKSAWEVADRDREHHHVRFLV